MSKLTIKISLNGKILKVNNVKQCTEIGKLLGLMFKSKNNANALIFDFEKKSDMKIHSFFVFFPFIALWLDDKNRIIEKRIINPFTLSINPKKSFSKLVEIPLNRKYLSLIRELS